MLESRPLPARGARRGFGGAHGGRPAARLGENRVRDGTQVTAISEAQYQAQTTGHPLQISTKHAETGALRRSVGSYTVLTARLTHVRYVYRTSLFALHVPRTGTRTVEHGGISRCTLHALTPPPLPRTANPAPIIV